MSEQTLFRTPTDVEPTVCPIQPADGCVLLGSCFAQEMGIRMESYGMNVLCNPLGTLYNPASIGLLVRHALHAGEVEPPVFEHNGHWHCWLAGTQITAESRDDITQKVTGVLQRTGTALRTGQHLFVTLGTNVCYRLNDDGMVVTNCHKMPASTFAEDTLSPDTCTRALCTMTDELLQANKSLHITFTVSPYRYAKYGFHRSQIAKATLLLAVEEVCQRYAQTEYFPAYEILMDELRDYRFYADDMLHPSATAADYIWKRLCQTYMSQQARQYLAEYEPIRRGLTHRPSDPLAQEYQQFVRSLNERRDALRRKYGMQ